VRGVAVGLSSGATKLAHRSTTTLSPVAHPSGVVRPQSQCVPPLLLRSPARFLATSRRPSPCRPSPPASHCRAAPVHLLELRRHSSIGPAFVCRVMSADWLWPPVHRSPEASPPRQSRPDKASSALPVTCRLSYRAWPRLPPSPPQQRRAAADWHPTNSPF
jgi:hypothetical protein